MELVDAGYEILTKISDGGLDELKQIERIARVCYKSEDKISEDGESARKMLAALIRSDHLAMLEHSTLSVLFTVDRGVSHELVRHRVASFAQESTRYVDYTSDKSRGECRFITPLHGISLDSKMQQMSGDVIDLIMEEWYSAMQYAESHYCRLIDLGCTPQIARSVLPNSTKTEITVTANYREWRHIFNLRALGTTGSPHPQMREVMLPLLCDVASRIPVIFDDQVENVMKLKDWDYNSWCERHGLLS